MKVVCKGVAKIEHHADGRVFTIQPNALAWDSEGTGGERRMGAEIRHFAEIEHGELGLLTWEVFEYPTGMFNSSNEHLRGHKLLSNFDLSLQHVPEIGEDELY